MSYIQVVITVASLCLTTPLHAEEAPPTGELVFLDAARPTDTPARVDPVMAQTYLVAAEVLLPELDEDIPRALKSEFYHRIGELIGRAWSSRVPDPSDEPSPALRRLWTESRRGNRAANAGLRFVVDTLVRHARADGRVAGPEPIERSLYWLARINGPIAVSALYSLSRDAALPAAREAATSLLAALARDKAEDKFTEACARLLLE